MNVGVARYLLGLVSLVVVCGSLSLAAVALRRRLLPDWTGALARLAEAVIGLGSLVFILEALGTIGLFALLPIVFACALLGAWAIRTLIGAGGSRAAPGAAGTEEQRPAGARSTILTAHRALAALGILITAAVFAEWASPTLQSYDVGIVSFDSLWYHLPWAASFAQTGHVTPLRFTDVQALTGFYPATAELLHGLGIVLLARDTLSPALNLLFLPLVLLAAWCIGRPQGVGALSAFGAALAMATPMMHFSQAGAAATDVVGVFFLIAAVALFANAGGRRPAYALAGLAAGFAVAVKLSLVAPVLALSIGVIANAPRGERRATAGLWLGCLVLAGGFWYVRNLIAVGNPLPWKSFGILPAPPQRLLERTAYSVSHYLTDSHAWRHFFEPALASGLGRWWYLILASAVIGPLLCLLPGATRTVRILGAVALLSLGAYVVTPDSAAGPPGDPAGFALNLRYLAPALTLALAVLPLAPVLSGPRRRAMVMVALTAIFVATAAQPQLWPDRHVLAAVCIGLVLLLAGLGLVWLRGRPRRGTARLPARAAPAPAVLVVAALVLSGSAAAGAYVWQRHYLRGRYAPGSNGSQLEPVWAFFRGVHHARVGIVGTFGGFFSYPLYGLDTSNRVQYIAHHGPHGSFTPITNCAEWRTAVDAGHFRYLVTTPARDPWHPKALYPSPEGAWTESDPAAHVVLRIRAKGQQIILFRLRGSLDPSGCGR